MKGDSDGQEGYSDYILENSGNFEFAECLEITIHGENSGV